MSKRFKPAFGMRNRHIQTLYSSLLRKDLELDVLKEKFIFSDGDFTEYYWYNKPSIELKKSVVILFHGLTGSYKSSYIQGAMRELAKSDFGVVLMQFRSCGEELNTLPRSYHSGETGDAKEFIEFISKTYKDSKLFGIGYSLGGNMLLKLLGEYGDDSPLSSAISVSAPLELDTCADAIGIGFSNIYQKKLVNNLNKTLERKFDKHEMSRFISLKKDEIENIRTFWEFDEAYTAPIHGFDSAKDYYTKCSAKQYLKLIKTKTLIIHSLDDPFMFPSIVPKDDEISKYVELEIYPNGGHVGFIAGTIFKPEYWLDKRVSNFFLER